MDAVIDWLERRPVTVGLGIFFVLWYVLQLAVFHFIGEDIASWWFYFEHNNGRPILSAGAFLAPISHKMHFLGHIMANISLLLFAGGFAEPYIGKDKIVITVIGLGYLGTYIANATVLIHGFWNIGGASAGILSLWAYAGLQQRHLLFDDWQIESIFSGELVEIFAVLVLLLGTPVLLFHETVLRVHSGHTIGILLGYLYYGIVAIMK